MQNAPSSYEELLEKWGKRINTAIFSFGFFDESEDIFQDLMLEFWNREYLEHYDPSIASFSTFLYGFINKRLLGYCRKRKVVLSHIVDLEFAEYVGEDDPEFCNLIEVVNALASHTTRGTRDLYRLFVDIADQISKTGTKNQSFLAKKYGVSPAAISMQMQDLRDFLVKSNLVYVSAGGYVSWDV